MAKFKSKGSKKEARPDGQIRHSQVITTYGPGALVDLVDQAVIIGGLEYWNFEASRSYRAIDAPRLRDHVVETYEMNLPLDEPFREPPAGDDSEPTQQSGIPALEFPTWFVCQKCRALVRGKDGTDISGGRRYHVCGRDKKGLAVPVRFVGACKRGHVQDFPWRYFTHGKAEMCGGGMLYLWEGKTGDFSEIDVSCECGARRKLREVSAEPMQPVCDGHRPWLGGKEMNQACGEKMRLITRSASNAYFPQVMSALTIPEPSAQLSEAVSKRWKELEGVKSVEQLQMLRELQPRNFIGLEDVSDDALLAEIKTHRSGKVTERKPLRVAEYEQLCKAKVGAVYQEDENFVAEALPADKNIPSLIERVVLVHKQREVRTQVGFTRLEPATMDNLGEYDLKVESAPLGASAKWLPAIELWGEGIFLQFSEDAVREWESRPAVVARRDQLYEGFKKWNTKESFQFPGIRTYMLHSLSHLLITALSMECGYAASAIRERLYLSRADNTDAPMAGILLSTGTSGSEGTLGGLVDQGRHIASHLRRAVEMGKLCSNDPVCASHTPAGDHAERYLEGAACHGCLFVAECSCERSNRYLDRALVVPTMGHDPALAFLGGVV